MGMFICAIIVTIFDPILWFWCSRVERRFSTLVWRSSILVWLALWENTSYSMALRLWYQKRNGSSGFKREEQFERDRDFWEIRFKCRSGITGENWNVFLEKKVHYFIKLFVWKPFLDVMLTIVGLIYRTPKNGIERRTPSRSKYQSRYRYLHGGSSIHTENMTRRTESIGKINCWGCLLI